MSDKIHSIKIPILGKQGDSGSVVSVIVQNNHRTKRDNAPFPAARDAVS